MEAEAHRQQILKEPELYFLHKFSIPIYLWLLKKNEMIKSVSPNSQTSSDLKDPWESWFTLDVDSYVLNYIKLKIRPHVTPFLHESQIVNTFTLWQFLPHDTIRCSRTRDIMWR